MAVRAMSISRKTIIFCRLGLIPLTIDKKAEVFPIGSMIKKRVTVDELFDDFTRKLGA